MKLLGYAPDYDPNTEGVLKDVDNIVPTKRGFRTQPEPFEEGLDAVSTTVNSLAVMVDLSGDYRIFVGTTTTIEENTGAGWTDRSGATYSCPAGNRWSFAQFGNYTLASNTTDGLQASTDAAFAAVNGAPASKYIAVSQGFVMAAHTSDKDGWHCSAYQDHTDWTEAIATQSTSGRIISGGGITGLKAFGSGFVIFKNNSMYVGTYVGAPVVFQWDEVPGDVGCPTSNAAVDIGDRLAFLGHDSFYIFDGARNTDIGEPLREWFFDSVDVAKLDKTIATYNVRDGNITWHVVGDGANDPSIALVYNIRTGKWGKYKVNIEAAASYYTGGVTYNELGTLYTNYNDLPTNISYDSDYWAYKVLTHGVVKTDHKLYTMTRLPVQSFIMLNTIGSSNQYTTVRQIRPRFTIAPESSSLIHYIDHTYGDNFVEKGLVPLSGGNYDLLQSSRWHQFYMVFWGNMEIVEVDIDIIVDGTE